MLTQMPLPQGSFPGPQARSGTLLEVHVLPISPSQQVILNVKIHFVVSPVFLEDYKLYKYKTHITMCPQGHVPSTQQVFTKRLLNQ